MLKLGNYWYIALPSARLRRRPRRVSVEGVQLVLYRDDEGIAHALVDRCVHRGMALSAGRVAGGCLQCPYHGWRYDGDGQVVDVPALCEGESLPRARTRSCPVRELDGHIWVWSGSDAPSVEPFRFPHHCEPGWSTFFMDTRFNAPVEACLENFLDVPHTLFVHPGLFRGENRRSTRVRVRMLDDGAEAEFVNEAALEGIGPRLLLPRGARMTHTDRFILPSITRVDYGFGERHGFVITSQCTQREDSVVDVTTAITWRLPVPAWIAGPFLRWYCRRVIRQDVDMLDIQGRQIREFGNTQLHTSADLLGRHIALARRRAAEGLREAPAGATGAIEETVLTL